MADYPAHLARARRLSDGRTVTIRPVRPDDEARERDFLNEVSGDSRYLRFQKWINVPSDRLIHFLTDIDYDRHMAFVCSVPQADGEKLVGEARYVVNPDGKGCEFGIVIADPWHKTGIAGLLMEALIRTARERGLSIMEGIVLARNAGMIRFARGLGFEVQPVAKVPATVRIVRRL